MKLCLVCNSIITKKYNESKNYFESKKFCSIKCLGKSNGQLSHSRRKILKQSKKCEYCKNLFKQKPNEVPSRFLNKSFCCKKCASQYSVIKINKILDERGRVSPNKGRIFGEDFRLKCRLRQLGKHPTEEQNQMRREKQLGKPKNHSKQGLENIKRSMTERRKTMILPTKNTKPERFLQSVLSVNDIKYKLHVPLKGQPDIFIEPNICIFVDGDYWHANPNLYSGKQLIKRKTTAKDIWIKDNKITKTLQNDGYKVIRFWESEILKNPYNTLIYSIS